MNINDEKQPFAFVIMPFDTEFNDIFKDIVVPTLESAGYRVQRADSVVDQRNIIRGVIQSIDSADLIIAELTTLNANVMYELGVAHALLKPTIMLIQDINEAPFDLKTYQIIPYSTKFNEITKLRNQLLDIATKHKNGQVNFENPVRDYALSLREIDLASSPNKPNEIVYDSSKNEEEPEWLDFVGGSIEAIFELTEKAQSIADLTKDYAEQINSRTAEIEQANKLDRSGKAAAAYRIVKATASDMIEFGSMLEMQLPGFRSAWDSFVDYTERLILNSSIKTEDDRKSVDDFIMVLKQTQSELTGTLNKMNEFSSSFSKIPLISKHLKRAIPQAKRAVDGVTETLSIGDAHLTRLLNLLDERKHEYEST